MPDTTDGNAMVIWSVPATVISAAPGPERNASPTGACSFGSITMRMVSATSSAVNGVPSEKLRPGPELKRDAFAVLVYLPRGRQLGLRFLRGPVYPDQHAAGKIADNFRRIVFH